MARLTYGPMVTELRGSIGGLTFQRNASGAIVRMKPTKTVNPNAKQAEQNVHLAQMVHLWHTVTPAQRGVYQQIADNTTHYDQWGRAKYLSAFQWFMSLNLGLISIGDPPAVAAFYPLDIPSPIDQFTLEATATTLKMIWPVATIMPAENMLIFATPPVRRASLKWSRSLLKIKHWRTATVSELDITADYEAAFNITWATFITTARAFITVRAKPVFDDVGSMAEFTSAQIKTE